MAAVNPPPQAYTKETVAQAYQGPFSQPLNIRETANDLDTMVALFLQAKRRRANAGLSTNPVSAKAFKDELKGLAENFKQFEPNTSQPDVVQTQMPIDPVQPNLLPPQPIQQPPAPVAPPVMPQTVATPIAVTVAPEPVVAATETQAFNTNQLDPKSRQQIQQVMGSLNLSSHSETLRLLISLGYEKVREILPSGNE